MGCTDAKLKGQPEFVGVILRLLLVFGDFVVRRKLVEEHGIFAI